MRRALFFLFLSLPLANAQPKANLPSAQAPSIATARPILDGNGLPMVSGMEGRKSGHWGPLVPEYTMEITAKGPSPADLTNRGLYQLQLFRSPQATRHFLAALEEDKACAMAWVGLYLALLERGEEGKAVREECHRKALELRPSVKPHEQAWIDALDALHQGGARAFAVRLEQIRQSGPADSNAAAWLPLMLRDGHEPGGAPRSGQAASEALIKMLLQKRADDPVLLHAWCQLALIGPTPEVALGQAKLMLSLEPPSAYFRQAAGLVLYRSGETAAAAEAFESARVFEEASLQAEGIHPVAAPTYFDNLDCLVMALVDAGRRDDALAVAAAARSIDLPWNAPLGSARTEYGFFTLTSAARVHARCGEWDKAMAALPPADHPAIKVSPMVATWMETLRLYLEGQLAIKAKDKTRARAALTALEKTQAALSGLSEAARTAGLDPQWSEILRLTDFLQYDLRAGEKFLSGDPTMATVWWRSAAGRETSGQSRAVPRWPRGAAESMAHGFELSGDPSNAVRSWEQAVRERPQSGWALRGLRDSRLASGDKEGSSQAAKALARVWTAADKNLRSQTNEPKNKNKN